jgi:hypothetical protein
VPLFRKAKPQTPPDLTDELGVIGVPHSGGVPRDEFLRDLQGNRGARVFREMRDNDAVCGGMMHAVETKLRACAYSVTPVDDSPGAGQAAEFVTEALSDMSHTWEDHLAEVVDMATYGFSAHELVYKRRSGPSRGDEPGSRFTDGKLGWRKLPVRAQETIDRWEIADDGGIQGFHQQAEGKTSIPLIPIDKAVLYRTSRRRNVPTGRSLLRSSFRSWTFRRRLEEIEGIGAERDLTGIPKIFVPARILSGSSDEATAARNDWVKIGEGLKQDETAYVMIPSERDEQGNLLYDVQLMGAPGTKTIDLTAPIERYSRQSAMAILADVILIGHEAVGSQALAVSKEELFDAGLQALADGIADTFTRYGIHRLMELNGFPQEQWPSMEAGSVGSLTLPEISAYVKDLASGGIVLDSPDLREWLSTQAGLPYAESDMEEA